MLPSDANTMQRAIATFANGFAFTRSFTHPYLVERVGPLWVMRDGPRKRGDYRTDVRPLLAQVRSELGVPVDPMATHRASGYDAKVAKERGLSQSSGGFQ